MLVAFAAARTVGLPRGLLLGRAACYRASGEHLPTRAAKPQAGHRAFKVFVDAGEAAGCLA